MADSHVSVTGDFVLQTENWKYIYLIIPLTVNAVTLLVFVHCCTGTSNDLNTYPTGRELTC